MERKSQGVNISSNQFNHTKMVTSSHTRSNKFSTSTEKVVNKRVFNRRGELVGSTSQTQTITSSNITSGIIGSTFGLMFSLLVLINLYGMLTGTGQFRGLEWLLSVLSNAPAIDTSWLETWGQMSITADWGIFQFLADFLNKINQFINLCAFLGVGCINILLFILYFVTMFLFGGY